jgi:hypothetical protein
MKKKALPFALSLLLISLLAVGSYGQNRDFKSSSGVRDLGTSEVTTSTEFYTPGTTMDVSFATIYDGDDSEYINQVDMVFSNTCTINKDDCSQTINSTLFGSNFYLDITELANDYTVNYINNGSGPIGSSDNPFIVNITIPGGFSGNLSIDWTLTGTDGKSTTNGTLTLTEASSVDDPTAFAASTTSTTAIGLSWTKNGSGDDVMIAYNTTNTFGAPSGTYSVGDPITGGGMVMYNGAGTSTTHSSLSEATMYYYKAFSVSGSKAVSYSDGVETNAMTAATLPVAEGFEDGGSMPTGWTLETGSGDSPWAIEENAAKSGSYGVRVEQTSINAKDAWLFSQPLSMSTGITYILDFYYRADGTLEEMLDVYIGTSPNAASMTTNLIDDLTFSSNTFTFKHETFSVGSTEVYYIGFHAVSAAEKDYIDLDDIEIGTGTPGLWNGLVDTDWSNASNWDDQSLPNATVDVTIPDVSDPGESGNFPVVTNAKVAAACNNLTIEENALLTVQSGGTLSISGDLVIESQYFGGSTTGNLVDQTNGGVTISGSVTVQQAILGAEVGNNDQWHLISSPVNSFNSTDVFEHCYLRGFDESTNEYVNIGENITENTAMKGYATMYAYGGGASSFKTLEFSGTLNTGNKSISCSMDNNGWNLVGNPYPSAIDWDLIDAGLPANLNKTYYVLDGITQTFKHYMNGGAGNTAGQYIPAMNGFFVECNNAAGATLSLQNSYRAAQQENFLKNDNSNDIITLKVTGNEIEDQITVFFRDQATVGFDRDYDVHKMFTAAVLPPQIYVNHENEYFAVNAYPTDQIPSEIPLGFLSGTETEFTFSLSSTDLINSELSLVLYDAKEDIYTDLRQISTYTFNYSISDNPYRFKLMLNTTGIEEQDYFPFNVWLSANKLMINTGDETAEHIYLYDISGKLIKEEIGAANQIYIQLPGAKSVYIIRIQTSEGIYTKKIVY